MPYPSSLSSIFCASNCRGQLKSLCQEAKERGASLVVHCGDFGIYDSESFDTLREESLRAAVFASPLISKEKKQEILSQDISAIRQFLKFSGLLSELIPCIEGRDRIAIDIPIYVVHGPLDDERVVQKFYDGVYNIQNIYLVNSSLPLLQVAGTCLRLFGAGGDVSEPSLFQFGSHSAFGNDASNPKAPKRGIFKMGQILSDSDASSPHELRILAVSMNPAESPLVYQLAAAMNVKFVLAPSLKHIDAVSTFNFSSLGLEQYLKFRCQEIEKACDSRFSSWKLSNAITNEDKSLLQLTERVWKTLPKSDVDTTFCCLPDATSGHAMIQASPRDLFFSSHCKLPFLISPHHDLISNSDKAIPLGSRQSSITSTAVSSPLQDSTMIIPNDNMSNSPSSWGVKPAPFPQEIVQSTGNINGAEHHNNSNLNLKKWDPRSDPNIYWDNARPNLSPMDGNLEVTRLQEEIRGQAFQPSLAASNQVQAVLSVTPSGLWEKISVGSDKENWDYASVSSDDSEDIPADSGAGVATLWVGNIPEEATEHDLKVYFRSVPIIRIRLSKKRPDKRPCAYVDVREEDMDRALRLSGERLLGARLKVEYDPNRLHKLRKKRESKAESPESLGDFERMRLQTVVENEPWAPGQLRKWSSTSALDVASAGYGSVTQKKNMASSRVQGKLADTGPNPASVTMVAAQVNKTQGSGPGNRGLTSSKSMNNLVGEPSTLNTALPAGWTTQGGSNASWDSPPRKPASFSSGADWDKPNDGGSRAAGTPNTAPAAPAPVPVGGNNSAWMPESAATGRLQPKQSLQVLPEPPKSANAAISSASWSLYVGNKGPLPTVDENSWMQNASQPKAGWNPGRVLPTPADIMAPFQGQWPPQRNNSMVTEVVWNGPQMSNPNAMMQPRLNMQQQQHQQPQQQHQQQQQQQQHQHHQQQQQQQQQHQQQQQLVNQATLPLLAAADMEPLQNFAPAWLRGSSNDVPQPVVSLPQGNAQASVIRRKGSLPNLPLMGKATWDPVTAMKPDASALWPSAAPQASVPVVDNTPWTLSRNKEIPQSIWGEIDPKTSQARLPSAIRPIGHGWEAAKAAELQSQVDGKAWGPTGWDWRRN
ncbi:hypothetical protein HDU97_003803 [Phlyctochytrium planicorne]|nr:hypothetical protein HDU97_003803 [Phlyctochytrium planicorne]